MLQWVPHGSGWYCFLEERFAWRYWLQLSWEGQWFTHCSLWLGTSCTSTRPSSFSIRAPAAELAALKWEYPCPKSRSIPPAIPGSLTGQRRHGQEHTKWWCWNWDCSKVLTGSSPGLTFWKLHSVPVLCPRISQQLSQCIEFCLHPLRLPWRNITDWLTPKQKLIPLGSEVKIKVLVYLILWQDFLTSLQMADFLVVIGEKFWLIMETPQSWSHLCSVKRLTSPQTSILGIGLSMGLGRKWYNVLLSYSW